MAHSDHSAPWWEQWDPYNVTVSSNNTEPDDAWRVCVIQGVYFGENEYNGQLGGRISAVFVILITSLIATTFPVVSKRVKWLRIPELAYTIAKMFGSGVIVATAYIHLMDPSYQEIGVNSCVGVTGNWAEYSWNAALMLAAAVFVFIVDAYCDFFADVWYGVHDHLKGIPGNHEDSEIEITENAHSHGNALGEDNISEDNESGFNEACSHVEIPEQSSFKNDVKNDVASVDTNDIAYRSQFAGFLTLEFGILFHSVMIGLTLGSSSEYATLYPVLVFHQAFEGLGIGARLSAIPFPKNRVWVPYVMCAAYALTTPIAIAIGLGVRQTYNDNSYTALVVSGVLDSLSAGILMYTGFVELLARDFIFNPHRTKNIWHLNLQLFVFLWGAGLMALLGKWA